MAIEQLPLPVVGNGLPKEVVDKLFKVTRLSVRQLLVIYWLDANYDSTGRIKGDRFECADGGCMDATVGYYHGVRNGCVILSNSVYLGEDGYESHRHIWSIPEALVVRVEVLESKEVKELT